MNSPQRRHLTFASLDAVVRDVEELAAKGYEKTGNWDLAQMCNHLVEWIKYPLDGYPKIPLFIRPVVWLMKVTVGKRTGRALIEGRGMKPGTQTLPQTVFPGGQDEAAAVANYKAVVERWKAHTGPLHVSPLFGTLTRDEWNRAQCGHAAHHLSLLVPRAN